MARKSRQTIQIAKANNYTPVEPESVKPAIRTGTYARLSLYDLNHIGRDSMQNQINLLDSHMEQHPELNLTDRYVDNGWSGMDFKRPAFQRLMEDIHSGRINCIVVKDLSRFGRNYIETGYYLENLFPALGVRFISINDHFDTKTSKPDDLAIILKNILNDFFSRDLSRRHSASYDILKEKGVFRHGTPYGYMHDPERPDYLTFDPAVSHYVHLIFQWALDGMPNHKIATQLRQLHAPTQERMEYLKSNGKAKHKGSHQWDTTTIRALLINPVYAGDFAYGKTRQRKCDPYNNIANIPREEWTIIPNAFPAYITHEQQEELIKRMEKNTEEFHSGIARKKPAHEEIPDYYKDIIYCSLCGRRVHTSLDIRKKSKSYSMYFCHQYGNSVQEKHPRISIHKKLLDTIILDKIQERFHLADEYQTWIQSCKAKNTISRWLQEQQKQLDELSLRLVKNQEDQTHTFELQADALITQDVFRKRLDELHCQEQSLSASLEKQANYLMEVRTALSAENPWLLLMSQFAYPECLNDTLTHAIIKRITLGPEQEVRIIFQEEHWLSLLSQCREGIKKEDSMKWKKK